MLNIYIFFGMFPLKLVLSAVLKTPNVSLELYREGKSLFRLTVLLIKSSQARFQDGFSCS
jgi:hypothetical protein